MTNALTTHASQPDATAIEQVLISGDLAKLTPPQRVAYYNAVCKSLGLNPLTKPFDYISLNGKLTLYAKRDCTDQLRKIHGVSITKLERESVDGVYAVTAYATDKTGRTDTAIGAVAMDNLKGEARANALMKAETKAKRRVTLSVCGLGMTDETEVESIPAARTIAVDHTTGEIVGGPPSPVVEVTAIAQPDGYGAWLDDMAAVAETGLEAFRDAWKKSKPEYRAHLNAHDADLLTVWKAKTGGQRAA